MHRNHFNERIKLYLTTILRWAPLHVSNSLRRTAKPVHILFCTIDHYEPGTRKAEKDIETGRVKELLCRYPQLAANHGDSAGNCPKRTWFFPPHYHRYGNLRNLVSLCQDGFGEIELHLHHGKTKPDSPENLERTIKRCVEEYSTFGIFGTENGRKKYGFVHGDWALDNSRGGFYCGVDNEIQILHKTGCYADFTFPCLNKANPAMLNSIFYPKDSQMGPKSYNKGDIVGTNGCSLHGDKLMIIQGPMRPYLHKLRLRLLSDALYNYNYINTKMVDYWMSTSIHVRTKPDWIFIKNHIHGAIEHDLALGKPLHDILTYLECKYNDGKNFILHYVTARELYNIIKAAEAGKEGNPQQYLNYLVAPPIYNSSVDCDEASDTLKKYIAETYNG
jgi:hypothetical protein